MGLDRWKEVPVHLGLQVLQGLKHGDLVAGQRMLQNPALIHFLNNLADLPFLIINKSWCKHKARQMALLTGCSRLGAGDAPGMLRLTSAQS